MYEEEYQHWKYPGYQETLSRLERAFNLWIANGCKCPEAQQAPYTTPHFTSTSIEIWFPRQPGGLLRPKCLIEKERFQEYADRGGLTCTIQRLPNSYCSYIWDSIRLEASSPRSFALSGLSHRTVKKVSLIAAALPLAKEFWNSPILQALQRFEVENRLNRDQITYSIAQQGLFYVLPPEPEGRPSADAPCFYFSEHGFRALISPEELVAFALAYHIKCRWGGFVLPRRKEVERDLHWDLVLRQGAHGLEIPEHNMPQYWSRSDPGAHSFPEEALSATL